MEGLLYFLIWGGLIFLIMRVGCGSHVMGHGHDHKHTGNKDQSAGTGELRWEAPAKDIDPVCGKTISTKNAKTSVYDGNVYYFCSRECREVFEAMPDVYLTSDDVSPPKQLEHSHG